MMLPLYVAKYTNCFSSISLTHLFFHPLNYFGLYLSLQVSHAIGRGGTAKLGTCYPEVSSDDIHEGRGEEGDDDGVDSPKAGKRLSIDLDGDGVPDEIDLKDYTLPRDDI